MFWLFDELKDESLKEQPLYNKHIRSECGRDLTFLTAVSRFGLIHNAYLNQQTMPELKYSFQFGLPAVNTSRNLTIQNITRLDIILA